MLRWLERRTSREALTARGKALELDWIQSLGPLDDLTQREPAAQSREPLPHCPVEHGPRFSRACTSTHTLHHALITVTLLVTLHNHSL